MFQATGDPFVDYVAYGDPAAAAEVLGFDVIAYRGRPVFSRAGWIEDVRSRGGVVTRVPGGFFHDLEAARFGIAPPFAYELQPIWLLVWSGVDVAADDFLRWVNYQGLAIDADNQRQDVADIGGTVAGGARAVATAINPTTLKLLVFGVAGLIALNLLSLFPRRRD